MRFSFYNNSEWKVLSNYFFFFHFVLYLLCLSINTHFIRLEFKSWEMKDRYKNKDENKEALHHLRHHVSTLQLGDGDQHVLPADVAIAGYGVLK